MCNLWLRPNRLQEISPIDIIFKLWIYIFKNCRTLENLKRIFLTHLKNLKTTIGQVDIFLEKHKPIAYQDLKLQGTEIIVLLCIIARIESNKI